MMTPAQFQHLVDAYGADPDRWPADRRLAAQAHLAVDPAARAALGEAARLDALIVRAMRLGPRREAAAERVAAKLAGPLPPQRRRFASRLWPAELLDIDFAPAWPRIAALAAAASLGVAIGLSDVTLLGLGPGQTIANTRQPGTDLISTVFEPDLIPGIRP